MRPTAPRSYAALAWLMLRGVRAAELRTGLDDGFRLRAETDVAAARAWYARQVGAAIRDFWRRDNRNARRALAHRDRLRATTIDRRPDELPHHASKGGRRRPRSPSPRPVNPMDRLLLDLRHGARSLVGGGTLALVAVVALALGTGGATAIFALVDTVVLRPLPYGDPDRIMTLWETSGDWLHNPASPANFLDWEEQAQSFETMAASGSSTYNLTGVDEPLRLGGYRVTAGFFPTLGVAPLLGRTFDAEDDRDGAAPVVVVSHGFWTRVLGADTDAVGSQLRLDGRPHTLIGVMPRSFSYPASGIDVWTPMAFTPEARARRGFRSLRVIGRLADGVSAEAAHDELVRIADGLRVSYPDANEEVSANVIPLRRELLGDVQPTLVAMAAAIGTLLLIACTNVATLLLARATGRRHEIAVRAAIGASPARITQQLFTESAVLAVAGAALGLALAVPGARFLTALIPTWVPLAEHVAVDGRSVAFCVLLSVGTAILFGLAPAARSARLDLSDTLRGARSIASSSRARRGLIVAQLAMAIVLLVGAGLLIRSFWTLAGQDLGFDADGVLRANVVLTGERYEDDAARTRVYDTVLERVRGLAGVESAAMITRVPLGMSGGALIYTPFEQATAPQDATYRIVTPDYFATLRIALRGRDFNDTDVGGEAVVIVGEELARRHWPGQDAIGKSLKMGDEDSTSPWMRVVGVAADVRQWNVEIAPRPAIYVPLSQTPQGFFAPSDLVVRGSAAPSSFAPVVRAAIHDIDADLPVTLGALSNVVDRALAARRFQMRLLMAFAAIAALIATVGLYGVIAYMVETRTREIGIRVALGAGRRRLLGMVLGDGLRLVAAGTVLGVGAAAMGTRLLSGLLYEIGALDPVTFVAVPTTLLAIAIVALVEPARRASRVDPMTALRAD